MSWYVESALPESIDDYKVALKRFKEQTAIKVLTERDNYIESYYAA